MANCTHIAQKVKDEILIKSTQTCTVSGSLCIKICIKNGAKINIKIQIISKVINDIKELIFTIFSALLKFFAHKFCQTIVETAIENHIAGIKINWKIFHQAQNQAKATVPKDATKLVIITIQKERADISIEEGNHKKNIFFKNFFVGKIFLRSNFIQ